MSIVFITEKPDVAKHYCDFLGVPKTNQGGYYEGHSSALNRNVIITWAIGHLVDICTPQEHNEEWGKWSKDTLPMIPKVFKYKPDKDKLSQFNAVKSVYMRKDIDCIYYAGDSAREGVYIQALIRNQIFQSAPKCDEKVVWINSLCKDEVLRGIKEAKPYSYYQNMINSGYARAKDDYLIGMNFSRAFTLTSGGYGVKISVGRVMTATLAMVVRHQQEIDGFEKKYYYGVKADNAAWKAVKGSQFFESEDLYNDSAFLRRPDAEKLVADLSKDLHLKIDNVKVVEKKEYAPFPFDQTSLPAYCKKFKLSPKKTLEIAQSLYERGYITYPRADSCYLSEAVAEELRRKHNFDVPKYYVNDEMIEDHHAVIPTFEKTPKDLSGKELDIYNAIYNRFMDILKPQMIYDAVSITYLHSNGEKFFSSFRNIKQKGFRENLTDEDMKQTPVPQKGENIEVSAFTVADMESKPPAPYNESDMPKIMKAAGKLLDDEQLRNQIKSCGLGTAATRADIIEKLKINQYIAVDDKGRVAPTELGKQIIAVVEKYDEVLTSPAKTAELEQQLSDIANGKETPENHHAEICKYVREVVEKVLANNTDKLTGNGGSGAAASGKCPHCGGEITKGKFGWYCKEKCGMNVSKVYRHELTDAQIQKLLEGKEISFTEKGRKTIVLPNCVKNETQGKTYYNWATKSGTGSSGSSNSSSGKKTSTSGSKTTIRWGKK